MMGGLALKKCITRRFESGEYKDRQNTVVEALNRLFPECPNNVIRSYRNKTSYGDLDVLITSDYLPHDWVEKLVKKFESKEHIKNGNVLSFEFDELQVDVIATPSYQMGTSKEYFAWNDLGNLCGRLAHSMGLKLGHDGLSYIWNCGTHQFAKKVISTDWEEICNVLGVSYERYCQGFDELEDIFKFVVSSPFFNKDIYLLHNRNNYARTRDKKRKTYTDFLVWIEGIEETNTQNAHKNKVDKSLWLPHVFKHIAGFEKTYNRVNTEWEFETKFKFRYNGDVVRTVTGLDGKELGKFMKWMRENIDQTKFRKMVNSINHNVVDALITYHYKDYIGEPPTIRSTNVVFAKDFK